MRLRFYEPTATRHIRLVRSAPAMNQTHHIAFVICARCGWVMSLTCPKRVTILNIKAMKLHKAEAPQKSKLLRRKQKSTPEAKQVKSYCKDRSKKFSLPECEVKSYGTCWVGNPRNKNQKFFYKVGT